ncbi:flagellar filament capping protein FliD [Bacillaceae bacterium IKA-2]|nr:flagellar filament capping protein FliD [Bacillaceae bacterium IKA-2]
MRIGGLASGMDTEQIIKDLMRAERMPMDKLTQQKQTLEWKRDSYRELNTMMAKFRDNIFDTVMRSANMSAKKVISSNPSFVTATATSAASNGSFTISKVDRLATAATNASGNSLSVAGGTKIDPGKDLYSQKDLFASGENGFSWKKGTVQKENITFTEAKSTLELSKKDFVGDADLAEAMSVKVNGKAYNVVTSLPEGGLKDDEVLFNRDTGVLDFGKDLAKGAKIAVTYATVSEGNYFTSSIETFNAEGKAVKETFAFQGSRTLNQVMTEVNASSVGVSMFYDSQTDKVAIQRKETGNFNTGGNEMIFSGGFFTDVLDLKEGTEKGGENAKFTINGLETERNSNTFNISGVTISLNATFETSPVNLNISTDVDKVFDTIVNFVKEYNDMLEMVNGKLTEEHHRDFKPLTEEQKEAMSEKDIETWEEKAMSGLLRRDQALSSGLDRLRVNIYSPVSVNNDTSNIRQLTDLGITTSRDYMDRGKLEIDESKLRTAIENDPEGVFQLFTADGPTNADKGLARRMRDSLDVTMRMVSERAGGSHGKLQNHQFTLGRNLNDIESRVSNFERRLQQIEERYWTQFTSMEKAMHQANAQAESMFSMLFGNQ